MPLFIDAGGAVADWLDTQMADYTSTKGLSPAWVARLATKVQSECRWKLFSKSNATVVSILNLYAGSSHIEQVRQDAHRVHSKNEAGTTMTWDALADFILDEIATQSNRLREIELSMIVVKSPVVLGTINTTITAAEKMMMAIRLSRGASLNAVDYNEKILTNSNASLQDKTYLPWVLNKSVASAIGDSSAGFTMRMALLHDLMEFSVSMFKSQDVKRVFGFGATPMAHAETVTTGDGVSVDRVKASEAQSIQYAKSLHCPVECGPSYTTTRLLRLPDTLSILTSRELAAGAAEPAAKAVPAVKGAPVKPAPGRATPEPADPMKRMSGVRVVPHAPGYLRLGQEQKAHIAWGILGWWTLNFPKHWGTGAHCFFEVSDAARSCGVAMAAKPGAYPTRQELCTRLQVQWTPADTVELNRRKNALAAGTEQRSA